MIGLMPLLVLTAFVCAVLSFATPRVPVGVAVLLLCIVELLRVWG